MMTPRLVRAFSVLVVLGALPAWSAPHSPRAPGPAADAQAGETRAVRQRASRVVGPAGAAPSQTLCVLDFNRLGNDPSTDWLGRGLADMMITTMNRLSPFQIVDRQHLEELLREHGLASRGVVDVDTGLQQARIAGAQLLLLGNFFHEGETVTVQARLIRVTDQLSIAMATWQGDAEDALPASITLTSELLARLNAPAAPASLAGIEKVIPRRINAAESFYRGMQSFDDGQYPQALAHYLDATAAAPDFVRGKLAVVNLYTFLERSEHAVVFASAEAERLEASDLQSALHLYFVAAELSLDSLDNGAAAIDYWGTIVALATAHEARTHEAAATKKFVRETILELHATGEYERVSEILGTQDLKYRIWTHGIDTQGVEMDKPERYRNVVREGVWVKEPVPEPSVFMWKTRAQLHLARAHARQGDAKAALRYYDAILADYEFVAGLPIPRVNETHLWGRDIELEALFVILHHYGSSGELLRDGSRMVLLNAGPRASFARDFGDMEPDPRARVWSRRDDGGHEYFDFAAPEGYQIDRAIVRVDVGGATKLSVYLPDPKGWPPNYDFSRLLDRFVFYGGEHEQLVELPTGTEFFSASVLWGPRWLDTPWEFLRWKLAGWGSRAEIASLAVDFVLTPKRPIAGTLPGAPTDSRDITVESRDADSLVVEHFAKRFGWDDGVVVRRADSLIYTDTPARDVAAMQWIVYSQDGEIHILRRDLPEVRVDLPVTINSRGREYDPSLVPTREGTLALLFTRGDRGGKHSYFVSHTRDMVDWQAPQRVVFDEPGGEEPVTGAARQQRTINVVALPQRYLMVVGGGAVRYSDDLRRWGPPQTLFRHDGREAAVVKTADGRIWVVGTRFVEEELAAGEPRDPWAGYFDTADGRTYKKAEAVHVTTSFDGIEWSEDRRVLTDRETSGLWAFPISTSGIGIAVSYNSLFLKWVASATPERFAAVDSPVQLPLQSRDVRFFVADGRMYCLRPVRDFVEEERVALLMRSRAVYERLGR